jgi:hypothetical protein
MSTPTRPVLFYIRLEQNQAAVLPNWPLAPLSQLVMARSWQVWTVLPMKKQLAVPSWVGMDWIPGYTWKGSFFCGLQVCVVQKKMVMIHSG